MTEPSSTRASLLLRLRDSRDQAAWKEFVELYAPLIYRYARNHGLQDADAMDLSQEVLTAVAGAVSHMEYDPQRGSFRSWLLTVVWRRLANWRRAQRIRPRGSGDPVTHQLLEQRPAPQNEETAWEAEWEQRVFAWACEQVRRDVTETTWQAFWRTAVEGQSGKEVAAGLGLSIAAVYLARSRVVARLKELVQSVQEPP
jgi:RNA polymerase sigma-70 factor (ECF subfamily)